MTYVTPGLPIAEAIETRLLADATLAAMLAGRKVYSTLVDRQGQYHAYPYVVLTRTTTDGKHQFHKKGHITKQELQLCGANKRVVLQMYDHIARLLDGVRVVLTDHTVIQGTTVLVMTFSEEDGSGERGIVEYSVHTHQG